AGDLEVGAGAAVVLELALAVAVALEDQAKEAAQAEVEEVAVAGGGAGEGDELEVAQGLEAVAQAVGVGLHRDDGVALVVFELGAAGLDVEEEEQAVEVHQRLARQLARELVVAEELLLADVADVADRLVGDELDGLAGAVLE